MPPKTKKSNQEQENENVGTTEGEQISNYKRKKALKSRFKQRQIIKKYNLTAPIIAEYEINDAVVNMNGNESVNTHTVNMPYYRRYWSRHIQVPGVLERGCSRLSDVFRAAGFTDEKAAPLNLIEEINSRVAQSTVFAPSIDFKNINMHDVATQFF